MMLAMTQEKLGKALGLTFQQVQKYEKGINRIGASRLQQISHILQVPVEFFFKEAPSGPDTAPEETGKAPSSAYLTDFLASPDGLRLAKAFMRIERAGAAPQDCRSSAGDRSREWHVMPKPTFSKTGVRDEQSGKR